MEPQDEPDGGARLEVPPRLPHVEGAPFDEDVGRLGDLGRLRQDLGYGELEIRVGVIELRRQRMCAEPRRDSARARDRA